MQCACLHHRHQVNWTHLVFLLRFGHAGVQQGECIQRMLSELLLFVVVGAETEGECAPCRIGAVFWLDTLQFTCLTCVIPYLYI